MTAPFPSSEETVSARLRLRRPNRDDLDAVFRIHGDPRTNVYNPAGPDRDLSVSGARLGEWLEHWERHDFGYWVVEATASTAGTDSVVVGFCGVRHEFWIEQPVLNLYYRFAPEHWGLGYAGEVARQAVASATEQFPGRPVLARTTRENAGSQRTAAAAGLVRRPELERLDNAIHAVILVTHWPNQNT